MFSSSSNNMEIPMNINDETRSENTEMEIEEVDTASTTKEN